MSDAATLGVICDLFAVALVALCLAVPLYAFVQRGQDAAWNFEGNVVSSPYNWRDGLAVLLLLLTLFSPFSAARPAGEALKDAPDVSSVGMLLANTLLMLLVALIVLAYLRVARGLNPAELFGMRQMTVTKALGAAFGALIVTYGAMLLGKYLVEDVIYAGRWPDNSAQETVEAFQHTEGIGFRMVMTVGAVFIAPVAEETLFRGLIYGVTKRFTDRWFAGFFSSIMFAIVHQHVGSLVPLFVLAMGFVMAYEATGCLLVPIFMHALFNALNIALLTGSS